MKHNDPQQTALQQIGQSDPDLREAIFDLVAAIPELRDMMPERALIIIAWCGVNALRDNPNLLKGSGLS